MNYDIIGDIHGHADKLEELLVKLGYQTIDSVYQHEHRKAIFVGDFIDRGTQNRRVIEIVRSMVDYNYAHAVMGNHEYNAICFHTRKIGAEDEWLRPHTKSKTRQHEAFLEEYPLGVDDTNEVITWFKTLPLFLEFEHFRVIHACWDKQKISIAKKYLNADNTLKEKYLLESAIKNDTHNSLYSIVERLLKGVEIPLPDSDSFKDKDGKTRYNIRVRWWNNKSQDKLTYRSIAFGYDDEGDKIPDILLTEHQDIPSYDENKKLVFFGHYWMTGTPYLQQKNLSCVDYSAGKGGELICYRFSNPADSYELNEDNFYWV